MSPKNFELEIVYGINKPLPVEDDEGIALVKVGAMGLFGIPATDADQYVLRAKIRGKDVQLDEAKTVADYELHNHNKVTLAAGAPFGRG
jgi:hypothetical protein